MAGTSNGRVYTGTLDATVAGTDSTGTPDVTNTGTINLAAGAKLAFVAGSEASVVTLTFNREEDAIGVVTLVVEYGSTLASFPNSVAIGATNFGPDALRAPVAWGFTGPP